MYNQFRTEGGGPLQFLKGRRAFEYQHHSATRTFANKFWLRPMISWFLGNMYNVALINEMQFLDRKAWYEEATLFHCC